MTIINESGVYSLIFGSKLPKAKKFKHWVTSEVLPSIRKNGGYIAGEEKTEPVRADKGESGQIAPAATLIGIRTWH